MNDIIAAIAEGKRLRVTIRGGQLGCSDAQDACDQYGYLILWKCGDQYRIDAPDGENIICVDDPLYIKSIIESASPLD